MGTRQKNLGNAKILGFGIWRLEFHAQLAPNHVTSVIYSTCLNFSFFIDTMKRWNRFEGFSRDCYFRKAVPVNGICSSEMY